MLADLRDSPIVARDRLGLGLWPPPSEDLGAKHEVDLGPPCADLRGGGGTTRWWIRHLHLLVTEEPRLAGFRVFVTG